MAGKPKYGLDFYYKPTNEFSNLNIRKLTKRYNHLGYAIYNVLLTLVHQSGQFYKFKEQEDLAFLVSDYIHSREDEALEVINYLVDNDFFDKESFNKGYLTSLEIQQHHLHATRRRKVRLHAECVLIDEKDLKNLKIAYIDSMYVYIDAKDVDNNDEIVDNNKHNNNHNQNNNQIIDKSMIKDFSLDEASVPFKIHYYLKILLKHEVIDITDPIANELNDYFNEINNQYHNDDLTNAVRYTASYIKKTGWIDANKHKIVNKKDYLIRTIEANTIKNQRERDGSRKREYDRHLEEYVRKHGKT